jgi:hypothetical protein
VGTTVGRKVPARFLRTMDRKALSTFIRSVLSRTGIDVMVSIKPRYTEGDSRASRRGCLVCLTFSQDQVA